MPAPVAACQRQRSEPGHDAADGTADRAAPGLAGRDRRRQLRPADAPGRRNRRGCRSPTRRRRGTGSPPARRDRRRAGAPARVPRERGIGEAGRRPMRADRAAWRRERSGRHECGDQHDSDKRRHARRPAPRSRSRRHQAGCRRAPAARAPRRPRPCAPIRRTWRRRSPRASSRNGRAADPGQRASDDRRQHDRRDDAQLEIAHCRCVRRRLGARHDATLARLASPPKRRSRAAKARSASARCAGLKSGQKHGRNTNSL